MMASRPVFCACCGTLLTAPQFYKGKAYGYTCITKVVPNFKRERDNGLWIQVDSVTHEQDGAYAISTAIVGGHTFKARSFFCRKTFNETGAIIPTDASPIQNGMMRVAKNKNGSKCLWGSLDVVTDMDSKGKLYPIKVIKYLDNNIVTIAEF